MDNPRCVRVKLLDDVTFTQAARMGSSIADLRNAPISSVNRWRAEEIDRTVQKSPTLAV
jgi:hypothetical protein